MECLVKEYKSRSQIESANRQVGNWVIGRSVEWMLYLPDCEVYLLHITGCGRVRWGGHIDFNPSPKKPIALIDIFRSFFTGMTSRRVVMMYEVKTSF